ncbi:hypothetical protein CGA21_22205, partial [Pseudomonas sp. PSB11]|nr:hypothetical protein [Pseudomonas sp. PSB11]
RSPVGAGLLAKAVCQATLMRDVMAPSRAGSLPHWICVVTHFECSPDPPVGASLLAKAVCQATLMLDVMASSRASPLPHWICIVAHFECSFDPLWE